MALYASFGFSLHPVVAAWGHLKPGAVTRPDQVKHLEPQDVLDRHLDTVSAIDRHVRGSARIIDIQSMLSQPGHRLLLLDDRAYAVAKDERIVTLGAKDEDSAALVLRTMLAEAPANETIEVNWLTSAQQWAIKVLTQAGIELRTSGPVMVRGMAGPPSPYIPSGGYG